VKISDRRLRISDSLKISDFSNSLGEPMINTNLAPIEAIVYRFRDIAFDMSKIAIFGYPSCV